MPPFSAGLLPYRRDGAGLRVFIVHMGGPLWVRKDAGGWSIAKGLYLPGVEDPLDAARREFAEEVGVPAPAGDAVDLGERRMSSGKRLRIYAVEGDRSLAWASSNRFTMEWPPRSGRQREFPETDRGAWCTLDEASVRLVKGQAPFLDDLARLFPPAVSASAR